MNDLRDMHLHLIFNKGIRNSNISNKILCNKYSSYSLILPITYEYGLKEL